MINKNKIEEAAKEYALAYIESLENPCVDSDNDMYELATDSFSAGAKWAHQKTEATDEQGLFGWPWYTAGETPKVCEPLLIRRKGEKYSPYFVLSFYPTKEQGWEWYIKAFSIFQWCYLDDILPKEGGCPW